MKLVKEHINEKFEKDSDPIADMGIGYKRLIEDWLKEYNITNYEINDDYTIDVYENVDLMYKSISVFPAYINFNKIIGNFSIQHNRFISLRGCPKIVTGLFSCSNNLLKSLEYAPSWVDEFYCHHNATKFTQKDVKEQCTVKGYIII